MRLTKTLFCSVTDLSCLLFGMRPAHRFPIYQQVRSCPSLYAYKVDKQVQFVLLCKNSNWTILNSLRLLAYGTHACIDSVLAEQENL